MSASRNKSTKRSYSKRMRLPNGFGQITKLKGNLRNPFRAMVTVGKTPMGKPICKLLKPKSYFKTYNEAYQALMEYHKDPIDLLSERMTCNDLYERWSEEHYKYIGRSATSYERAWRYCSDIHHILVVDVRPKHIKKCILEGIITDQKGRIHHVPPSTQSKIKSLWNLMLDFALEHEYVSHNYAKDLTLPKEVSLKAKENYKGHHSLSEDEVKMLSENITNQYVRMAIVQCYMGWRPGELVELRCSDVDLENMTITGGSKTAAGKNRTVPIHPAIQNIIYDVYDPEHEKLFGARYWTYQDNVARMLPGHSPHDFRKTFVTMAKKYNVNDYAIKRLVGHTIHDLTEAVYTDRNIDWLRDEIEKIPDVGIVYE